MPSSGTARTASARSGRWRRIFVVLFTVTVFALALWRESGPQFVHMSLASENFRLEVADTDAARQQGLSGRTGLPPNQGMLFMFSHPARQCFWMKDMRFSLDIIWADSAHHVVQVLPDLSPNTYPQTFCAANTQYVIELPAGTAAHARMQTGALLVF